MKRIAPDKWRHFFVGIAMGMVLQLLVSYLLPGSIILAVVITLIIIIIISYGFELLSLITGKGNYEVRDAFAGALGGVIGMGLILLTKLILVCI